jgi:hypothetical protein
MPTLTETPVDAYAHCVEPRCQGTNQEPVKAIRKETAHTYRERGGDMPGIEASWVVLAFENEDEINCPHCGRTRELSVEQRKTYAALSGHDPMGLLGAPKFDAKKQRELRSEIESKGIDPDTEALRQQNEMLMKRLAALEAKDD